MRPFIDDRIFDIPVYSPTCVFCKHLRDGRSCDAFPAPDSIPMEIWIGDSDHREPYPGDRGIRFEMTPGREDDSRPNRDTMLDASAIQTGPDGVEVADGEVETP